MQDHWGFYGRNKELTQIGTILDRNRWFFCAISGRRRIGKTTLIQRATQLCGKPHFYFQVPDSDERGVVQAFEESFEDTFAALGLDNKLARSLSEEIKTFPQMITVIRSLCETGWIVTIDEFQYFHRKALSPFTSLLQATVDALRDTQTGGIFVLGSIHTEMTAVLEDQESPLFNRVTDRIDLTHWDFETLFEMFDAHGVQEPETWLFLWSLFEGVPKFYRDAFDQGVLGLTDDIRKTTLRSIFFEGTSPLRDEAENWFLRELRGRYDTVLKILANIGTCDHGRLKAEYSRAGERNDKQLGGYLAALIDRYGMVEKLSPVFAGRQSRKSRYHITDNFLLAWLNAISRNVRLARVQPIETAVERADSMMMTVEGFAFEKMIRALMEESSRKGVSDFPLTDIVRGYWNKADGSDVEIDVLAINDVDKRVRFGSCKRSASKHSQEHLTKFETHIQRFQSTPEGRKLADWSIEKALYAPVFSPDQRAPLEARGYICRDIADYRGWLYH